MTSDGESEKLQTDNQLLLWETEMLKVNNSNNLQKHR